MSYRNPQIIVDRTSEAWAQGAANISNMAVTQFNNYLAKKEKDKKEIQAGEDLYNKEFADASDRLNTMALNATGKYEDNSLYKQQTDYFKGVLNGSDGKKGLISDVARMRANPSSMSDAERKSISERLTAFKGELQMTTREAKDLSEVSSDFNVKKPNDKVHVIGKTPSDTLIKRAALMNIENGVDEAMGITGIKKTIKRNNKGEPFYSFEGKIDTNSEKYKNLPDYMKPTLEELNVDKNGIGTIKLETTSQGLRESVGQAVEGFNFGDQLAKSNVMIDGKLSEGLIVRSSRSFISGGTKGIKGTSLISERDILSKGDLGANIDAWADSVATEDNATAIATINKTLGRRMTLKEWSGKTIEEKKKYISDDMKEDVITESAGGGYIKREATPEDVKAFARGGKDIKVGETIYAEEKETNKALLSEKDRERLSTPKPGPTDQEINVEENFPEIDAMKFELDKSGVRLSEDAVNLAQVAREISKYNFMSTAEYSDTEGVRFIKVTKTIDGADRSIVIAEGADAAQVKKQLKFLERGDAPVSKVKKVSTGNNKSTGKGAGDAFFN